MKPARTRVAPTRIRTTTFPNSTSSQVRWRDWSRQEFITELEHRARCLPWTSPSTLTVPADKKNTHTSRLNGHATTRLGGTFDRPTLIVSTPRQSSPSGSWRAPRPHPTTAPPTTLLEQARVVHHRLGSRSGVTPRKRRRQRTQRPSASRRDVAESGIESRVSLASLGGRPHGDPPHQHGRQTKKLRDELFTVASES
jgi:hypothetical protein